MMTPTWSNWFASLAWLHDQRGIKRAHWGSLHWALPKSTLVTWNVGSLILRWMPHRWIIKFAGHTLLCMLLDLTWSLEIQSLLLSWFLFSSLWFSVFTEKGFLWCLAYISCFEKKNLDVTLLAIFGNLYFLIGFFLSQNNLEDLNMLKFDRSNVIPYGQIIW